MKKRRAREQGAVEMEINMVPMIDIVFQLLIFFVLTAKFIEHEGELRSYLPRNRGLQQTVATSIDLDNVTVFLDWVPDPGSETGEGHCIAITTNYRPMSGGAMPRYNFPLVAPAPSIRAQYQQPDFREIEEYIRYRKETYSGIGYGLPVTVNFTDAVPVQMIVNMIDICLKLGVTDFALNAQGIE
jgi:hypothetical protein